MTGIADGTDQSQITGAEAAGESTTPAQAIRLAVAWLVLNNAPGSPGAREALSAVSKGVAWLARCEPAGKSCDFYYW